jgi:hypothetical protein
MLSDVARFYVVHRHVKWNSIGMPFSIIYDFHMGHALGSGGLPHFFCSSDPLKVSPTNCRGNWLCLSGHSQTTRSGEWKTKVIVPKSKSCIFCQVNWIVETDNVSECRICPMFLSTFARDYSETDWWGVLISFDCTGSLRVSHRQIEETICVHWEEKDKIRRWSNGRLRKAVKRKKERYWGEETR